jgi:hypothetical protein
VTSSWRPACHVTIPSFTHCYVLNNCASAFLTRKNQLQTEHSVSSLELWHTQVNMWRVAYQSLIFVCFIVIQ